jgi:hypothetical protein
MNLTQKIQKYPPPTRHQIATLFRTARLSAGGGSTVIEDTGIEALVVAVHRPDGSWMAWVSKLIDRLETLLGPRWEKFVERMTEYEKLSPIFDQGLLDHPFPPECGTCRGTGIGQFGDPNTSKCHCCGGRGVPRDDRDDRDDRD